MKRDMATLYRGLAVSSEDATQVEQRIWSGGMSGTEGQWRLRVPDISQVRASLESLFSRPDLSCDHVLMNSQSAALCACGTAAGAAHYALRHNRTAVHSYPLVVEFTVSIDDICVDPRDFLCTGFQFWDRRSSDRRAEQSAILSLLFGAQIPRYFDACQSTDQGRRIAMCNLASFDREVALAHLQNKRIIGGRHGTRFASAFLVKAPVTSGQISRVYRPRDEGEQITSIRLDELI